MAIITTPAVLLPVVAKIIDYPHSSVRIKNRAQKMATMLAKITHIPRSEYQPLPPLFSDSNGGNGDEKNVKNYGHHQ